MLNILEFSANHENVMWTIMWRIHLLTGFRQGEVLGLTWENLDFNEGSLRLHRQLQRQKDKGLLLKTLKAAANKRTIQLDTPTLALLRI